MRAHRTIAVLSPGEMGSQVAHVLTEEGARVLTWVEGRSEATRRRAQDAGLESLPTVEEVARQSDLIISIVPPSAAEPLARQVAAAIAGATARPLYCDANSIGPKTARTIERAITDAGSEFVDGAIIGGANGLRQGATFYLSGAAADRVAALLQPLRTSIIGSEPGQASAFKVLYAGLTKGLSALGVELLAGANRLGILDLLLDKYRSDQSAVARFWEHTLPGLPPRAGRRAEEMLELAQTLEDLGLEASMARAAQATLEAVADHYREDGPPSAEELEAVVRWWVEAHRPAH